MELQFKSAGVSCLRRIAGQTQQQEQTQELRLNDALPDIGSVLGAWGQVIVRGKQWLTDVATLSCGVMVWVLYAPEDGTAPQCLETWLPMTVKWDLNEAAEDGTLICFPAVRSVDARVLSGRKLMVRANIGVSGQCFSPFQAVTYTPEEVPADIQLLKKDYPMRFIREAGEKAFALDEELTLPDTAPVMEKPVQYSLQTELTEQKLIGDKLVFRGVGALHILYRTPEGALAVFDGQIPFSQYAQLEQEYTHMGQAQLLPLVTALEVEAGEQGRVRVKAGVTGQYLISDITDITVVEDAYSAQRKVELHSQELLLPTVLEQQSQRIRAEQTAAFASSRIADVTFNPGCVQPRRGGKELQLQIPGLFQTLYYNDAGALRSGVARWQEELSFPLAEGAALDAVCMAVGRPQATPGAEHTLLRGEVLMTTMVTAAESLTAVTALTVGDQLEKDPDRPSLILRRAGAEPLWDIAKAAGSTVDAICAVNDLQGQPDPDKMLLIPII